MAPVKPMTAAQIAAEKKRVQKERGDNAEPIYVLVDPNSYAVIKARQGFVKYFNVKQDVPQDSKKYEPREVAENSAATKRTATDGATQRSGVARGKLIKVPTNPDKRPADKVGALKGKLGKQTAVLVDRKHYHLRVPHYMSINAIAIMINTQFQDNKPPYIIMPSGKKWYINAEYKDKSKLPKLGKNSGGAAKNVPEDKENIDDDIKES